jgi:hypothetical protein
MSEYLILIFLGSFLASLATTFLSHAPRCFSCHMQLQPYFKANTILYHCQCNLFDCQAMQLSAMFSYFIFSRGCASTCQRHGKGFKKPKAAKRQKQGMLAPGAQCSHGWRQEVIYCITHTCNLPIKMDYFDVAVYHWLCIKTAVWPVSELVRNG